MSEFFSSLAAVYKTPSDLSDGTWHFERCHRGLIHSILQLLQLAPTRLTFRRRWTGPTRCEDVASAADAQECRRGSAVTRMVSQPADADGRTRVNLTSKERRSPVRLDPGISPPSQTKPPTLNPSALFTACVGVNSKH